ncbi:MAG: MarR family transcriptional regulator [Pseudomonadota bacterium]
MLKMKQTDSMGEVTDAPLDVKQFLTYQMARVQAKLNAQAAAILKRHSKLSLVQWRVMTLLASGGDNLTSICRLSGMDKGQVSRKLTQLVSQGLVLTRLDEADHRSQKLSLSEKGEELHARILPIMRARQAHLASDMSDDEQAMLRELLLRLEVAAEQREF